MKEKVKLNYESIAKEVIKNVGERKIYSQLLIVLQDLDLL